MMLVVPNRHQSVYTRLWCSYEAYLAQESGKTILIANSSNFSEMLGALVWLVLAAIFGIVLGLLATFLGAGQTFTVPALTILICGFSLVIYNDLLRRVMHFVGVMLCWTCVVHNFGGVFGGWPVVSSFFCVFHAGMSIAEELRILFPWIAFRQPGEYAENYYQGEGAPHKVIRLVRRCYWLLTSVAFCVFEVDRINGRATVSEAEELRRGYLDSTCHENVMCFPAKSDHPPSVFENLDSSCMLSHLAVHVASFHACPTWKISCLHLSVEDFILPAFFPGVVLSLFEPTRLET